MGRKKKLGFIKEFNIYTSKKLIFKILTSFQWKRQDLIISIILRQHKQQQGRGQGQHPLPSNVHRLRKPRKTKHPSSQIKLSFKLAERKTLVLSRDSLWDTSYILVKICVKQATPTKTDHRDRKSWVIILKKFTLLLQGSWHRHSNG